MIHILASTSTRYEFATAEAINDMGGIAIVPRTLEIARDAKRNRTTEDKPVLGGYMFLALTPSLWHRIKDGILAQGRRIPIWHRADIGPREWLRVQAFAAEVEADYQYRAAMVDDMGRPRQYLAPYNVADKLHILGGDLEARFIRSLGTVDAPMIEASVTMFGREITVKLDADKVGSASDGV